MMMSDLPISPAPTQPGAARGRTVMITVPEDVESDRLDRVLAGQLPELSRSRLKSLIEQGYVRSASGAVTQASLRVGPGQSFAIFIEDAQPAEPLPQQIDLSIVYEDAEIIVIDKPAGMVVHPAPGNRDNTLVNALLAHCGLDLTGIGGVARPGIVHRIDKDTSGLLVAAKTAAAHAGLSVQFAKHTIDRAYRAIVWGVPVPPKGTITGNIGRSPADRKKMAVLRQGGRNATTHYAVLRGFHDIAAEVECRLDTGRTHQIRVHMTHLGHPLIGDPVYGRADRRRQALKDVQVAAAVAGFDRQALHATRLGFVHPTTGQPIAFDSKPPADFEALAEALATL